MRTLRDLGWNGPQVLYCDIAMRGVIVLLTDWFIRPMVCAMSNRRKAKYELGSAVTFFLIGLGIGASSVLVHDPMPRSRAALASLKHWRSAALPIRSRSSQAGTRAA